MNNKCLIQGYPGSYHEAALRAYFGEDALEPVACDSFDILAKSLDKEVAPIAMMAIENSIAGSILQNYRILREHKLEIVGEQYLQIQHQLMALPGHRIEDIHTVISHPMALNQCLEFLDAYPTIERKEFSDTALAAKEISENQKLGVAAIASSLAADIYQLNVLAGNIETVESNYTRFFVVQKHKNESIDTAADKASIYLKLKHHRGSLLEVLNIVNENFINLSKLQSFPVLGAVQEYYFYLDLEFDDVKNFNRCIDTLKIKCLNCETMGLYKKAAIKKLEPLNIVD